MRIVIIVLVVVAAAFAFVAIRGGTRSGSGDAGNSCVPPPGENGKVDEDSLSGWKPCSTTAFLAKLTQPFAPKLKLARPDISLAAGETDSRSFPSSSEKARVARIQLRSGGGLRVTYSCVPKEGRDCPGPVCLCSPGAEFTSLQIADCPDKWRGRRLAGERCTKDDAQISLVIYPEAGALGFTALGSNAVSAQVK